MLLAVEPMPLRGDLDIANPLAVTALGETLVTLVHVVGYTVARLVLVVVGGVVRRWYRARGIEQQQFRCFASAAVLFPILFVVAEAISETVGSAWSCNPVVLAFFGMNGVAAAIGVAVARYRLFEIDRLMVVPAAVAAWPHRGSASIQEATLAEGAVITWGPERLFGPRVLLGVAVLVLVIPSIPIAVASRCGCRRKRKSDLESASPPSAVTIP